MTTLPDTISHLDGLRRNGVGWIARCPVHDDHNPSLSLTVTDAGKVLAKCHAGCDQTAVAEALDLRGPADSHAEWTPHGDATAVYDYRDEYGQLLFQVLRTLDKQFPQRRPDPTAKTGWRWSLGDTRRVLFRLPELLDAVADDRSVCITEGEKDALALVAHGKVATCNPGGAGKWRPEYAIWFTEADVTIFADKDKPGQAHARTIATSLEGVARRVWIVEAADPHKDIAAHLGAGLTLDQVVVTRTPEKAIQPDLAPDVHTLLDTPDPDYEWLVPNLLERGERFMLTGFEGLGKSVYLRMLAVCFAAGIHPVTFDQFDPLRVLVIDCENTMRQNRRAYRPLVDAAAAQYHRPVPAGNLRIVLRPEGVDLCSADDAAWLLERVIAHRPDVLILGPLYRLHLDNPNDEQTARRVVAALDAARVQADCAVMLEAHAGHGEWGKNRSVRPVGSSLYLRWPEFGYGLRPESGQPENEPVSLVDLVPWRGARDERAWPRHLRRGSATTMPWLAYRAEDL
jgi:hypothetical protein